MTREVVMSSEQCALGTRPGAEGCQIEEIRDADVREVAAVDRPATNREPFGLSREGLDRDVVMHLRLRSE
jgi:hypothetical protein